MQVLMPEENPRRRARRRKRVTPPRGAKGRFVKRRRRNPALMTVNPRRRSAVARRRRRRRNDPAPAHHPRRRTYRRRHNPRLAGFLPPLMPVLWGAGGFVGAAALPNLVLGAKAATTNKGIVGAALELASAVGLSFLARTVGGTRAAVAVLTGGGIRVAYRVAKEYGLLAKVPGLADSEEVGPIPGFAGYLDPSLAGMIDATPTTPQFLPELELGQDADFEPDLGEDDYEQISGEYDYEFATP